MLSATAVALVTALLAGLWVGFGADAANRPAAADRSVTARPAPTPPATPAAPLTRTSAAAPEPATDPFAPRAAAPTSPRPPAVPSRPPVLVLNNSRVAGLAAWAATRLRALGWPVAGVGNRAGRLPVTTLYYAPGQRRAAVALAHRWAAIRAVRPATAGATDGGLVLVVTRDAAPAG